MSATKGSDEEGAIIERKVVETVDYRSPAGQDKEPTKEKVQVVHLTRDKGDSNPGGGALAGVANTIRSAKDHILGPAKDTSTTTKP